jgi:hypothetical protein
MYLESTSKTSEAKGECKSKRDLSKLIIYHRGKMIKHFTFLDGMRNVMPGV